MKVLNCLAVGLLTAVIAACGGGGGSSGTTGANGVGTVTPATAIASDLVIGFDGGKTAIKNTGSDQAVLNVTTVNSNGNAIADHLYIREHVAIKK